MRSVLSERGTWGSGTRDGRPRGLVRGLVASRKADGGNGVYKRFEGETEVEYRQVRLLALL